MEAASNLARRAPASAVASATGPRSRKRDLDGRFAQIAEHGWLLYIGTFVGVVAVANGLVTPIAYVVCLVIGWPKVPGTWFRLDFSDEAVTAFGARVSSFDLAVITLLLVTYVLLMALLRLVAAGVSPRGRGPNGKTRLSLPFSTFVAEVWIFDALRQLARGDIRLAKLRLVAAERFATTKLALVGFLIPLFFIVTVWATFLVFVLNDGDADVQGCSRRFFVEHDISVLQAKAFVFDLATRGMVLQQLHYLPIDLPQPPTRNPANPCFRGFIGAFSVLSYGLLVFAAYQVVEAFRLLRKARRVIRRVQARAASSRTA